MKFLYLIPRLIAISLILFISVFSLDVFEANTSIWEKLGGFFIHLIPSFILIGILIPAWRYELIGGIAFIILGIIAPFLIRIRNFFGWILFGCLIIIGILFVLNHFISKKPPGKAASGI